MNKVYRQMYFQSFRILFMSAKQMCDSPGGMSRLNFQITTRLDVDETEKILKISFDVASYQTIYITCKFVRSFL